jgi:hypothetical protein
VQGAHHLQGAHHAQDAVEAPALGLAVHVRAAHHRRQTVVLPGATAEDVAHLIDRDLQVDFLEPLDQQVPRAPVLVAQRQAGDTAAGGGADPGHFLQGGPEPLAVDAHLACVHEHTSKSMSKYHLRS